jgi:hypothetical protein
VFQHSFMPYLDLSYIPNVVRDGYFPQNNQLMFSQDAVVPEQLLTLGWSGGLSFQQNQFQKSVINYERLNLKSKNEKDQLFVDSFPLKTKFLELRESLNLGETETLDSMRADSFSQFKDDYFLSWASEELGIYNSLVEKEEFGQNLVWPSPEKFVRAQTLVSNPFTYGISTSYNFLAEKSASEFNKNLNRGEKKQAVQYWGDILLESTLSAAPLVNWSVSGFGKWKREWKRFRETSLSTSAQFPLGLAIDVFKTDVYTEAASSVVAQEINALPLNLEKEQNYGFNANLKVTDRIVLNYGRKLNLKPVRTVDADFEQSNIQKISFIGLQDCLDITLQRFKDFKDLERMATWSIGLNLRFFGQQRPFDNIAGSLDREMKRLYAKK